MVRILIIDDENKYSFKSDSVKASYFKSRDILNIITIEHDLICINRNNKNISPLESVGILNKLENFNSIKVVIISEFLIKLDRLLFENIPNIYFITEDKCNIETLTKILNMPLKKIELKYNSKLVELNSYILKSALHPQSRFQILEYIIEGINSVVKNDIIVIVIKENNSVKLYLYLTKDVNNIIYKDFIKFCLHDTYSNFSDINVENIPHIFLNKIDLSEFNRIDLSNKKISSYYYKPLFNSFSNIIGSIHIGNFINNYYQSEKVQIDLNEVFSSVGQILGNSILFSEAEKKLSNTLRIFSKFIPAQVINTLLERGEIDRKGITKRICILFSDIRSFTSISEMNNAESVVGLLNRYFNIMVKCIKSEGGIIDKFIGDAIVAIFGAPEELDNIEIRATNAAKKMISSLKNVETKGVNLPEIGFKIGIGLHSGDAIVGNIGSLEKMTYTSIGNISLVAEHLESLTKSYKKPILITKSVSEFVDSQYVDSIELDNELIEVYSPGMLID